MKRTNEKFIVKLLIVAILVAPSQSANESHQVFDSPSFADIVKDKCFRAAGSENAYEQVLQSWEQLITCLQEKVDVNELQSKFNAGEMNEDALKFFCQTELAVMECIGTFSHEIDTCLEDEERETKNTLLNIAQGVLKFVCVTNTNQIAHFLKEDGPKCIEEKWQNLTTCFNSTYGSHLDQWTSRAPEGFPKLVMSENKCDDMQNLSDCVVPVLKTCNQSSPANLVQSLFTVFKQEVKCAELNTRSNTTNGRESSHVILATCLLAFLGKFLVL